MAERERVLRETDKAVELLEKWRADVLRIYDVVEHNVHDVLVTVQRRLSEIKDPKEQRKIERKALHKSWKQLRTLRNVVRDAHRDAQEFLAIMKWLVDSRSLYTEYLKSFRQLTEGVRVYDASLVRTLSWRRGDFVREFETPALSLDKAITATNSVINGLLSPTVEEIAEVREFLHEQLPIIEQRLIEDATFTVTLDAVTPPDAMTLADASFIRRIELEKVASGKTRYTFQVSAPLHVPRRVWNEMVHRPLWSGAALVSRQLLDYLKTKGHVEIITVSPTKEETDDIVSYWEKTTSGSTAPAKEREQFPKSGDVSLLAVTLREHPKPIIILSNDAGLAGTVKMMQRKGKARDVRVYAYAGKGALAQMV